MDRAAYLNIIWSLLLTAIEQKERARLLKGVIGNNLLSRLTI